MNNHSIDSIIKTSKSLYEEGSQRVEEVTTHIMRLLPFWLAGSLTALIATTYAKVFSYCEELSLMIYNQTGYWLLLITPLSFLLSWLIVEKLSPTANGSGIPQLMTAIELTHAKKDILVDKFLSLRIILVKIISSLIGVIGGGAIGREGPTLQIAGSIFHIIDKKWKYSDTKTRHGFLLAGAASGLASAFNTPLGGIVYVIEELAKSHLSTFRTGVVHAVIFAGIISQLIMGPYLYFGYPKTPVFHYGMIWQFTLLSVFSGALVAIFTQGLKLIVIFRSNLKKTSHKALFTIFVGFLLSSIAIWVSKNSLGPGKNLLNDLLFNGQVAKLTDIISRFFGSMLTYANGGAGGIFAPILSLGGVSSSFTAGLLNFNLGPLAVLIGMTAGLAALTHSPLTSFILILEMTDRHSSIFPLMIAAVVGHGVSKLISAKSFYEFVFDRLIKNYEGTKNESSD